MKNGRKSDVMQLQADSSCDILKSTKDQNKFAVARLRRTGGFLF
jgi:hypothetical protein